MIHPLRRNAIIGFINNFGQIPKQLFKKPHPCKKLNSQLIYGIPERQFFFFNYLNCLKPSLQPIKELKSHIERTKFEQSQVNYLNNHNYIISYFKPI
jgi:hypothetical protein